MSRREFQFTEGSSNKFWAIELSGKSHTVHFGRVGTSGQAQTKEFASEDEAKRSHDKLIAEKVKKGYTEVTGGTKSAGTPTAKVKKADDSGDDKPKAKEARSEEAPPAAPAAPASLATANANVTRTIELEPDDWRWAAKGQREPMKRPEPSEFNLAQCVERLRRIPVRRWGWEWDWEQVGIPLSMSDDEAQFWFSAMTSLDVDQVRRAAASNRSRELPKLLADRMAEFTAKKSLSLSEAKTALERLPHAVSPIVVLPLVHLFSVAELLELMNQKFADRDWSESIRRSLVDGLSRFVIPFLSSSEVKALQNEIRRALDPANAPTDFYHAFPLEYYLAAALGMPGELAALVQTWADDRYAENDWGDHYQRPQTLIFGLGDGQQVAFAMRRLKLRLRNGEQIRAFLALTEYSALDVVCASVLAETKAENAEELLKEFCRVKAPEAAPYMLELKLSSKAPSVARQWLDEHVGNAVAGLIPTAAGRGKLADAAIEYLREARKKGHENLIRECLRDSAPEVADSIKKNVLEFAEKVYPLLDAKSLPGKLKATFDAAGKKGKLPAWAAVTSLPPIIIGEKRLGDEQTTQVLDALQRSSPGKADPLVAAIREHADPASLDAFAWKLFQLWQGEGCPSKEKWAMGAIGLFGGDASALKLTPLVRNWPGESQHQRAVFGLECLRAIGSDTALMQLNGIAQKLKFKGLKQKATEAMEAIAKEKGLTRSQLEDRIVPDCDLDERGSRVFDFGPRQFRFVLGPEMKPMLKDGDGKVKGDLPKPGAKDDAAKANEAIAAWKLMKKQIKEVANIQAQRLEQAMVTGRRWNVADFETLLVKQPLMTNLVRLLLWGSFDKNGQLTATFRVTEDQTYADAKDGEFKLKGIHEVGIVHPLQLTDEQKSAWGEIFSDYEIVPPFPQLGRTAYKLEKDEEKAAEIKRFVGIKLPAPTLVFGLEKYGWIRGLAMDGGCFDEHSKSFPAANVTAVVHYEGTVGMGYIDPNEEVKLESCYFVGGQRGPSGYSSKEETLKLSQVNPVAVSEVLSDLTALAAKAK